MTHRDANTVIAPGSEPVKPAFPTDINDFHYSHRHSFEANLRKNAAQIGVMLEGSSTHASVAQCTKVHGSPS